MATYRVTWQFNENTGATFNEVYYRTAGTPAAAGAIDAAITARLPLLHNLNTLLQIRVADVDNVRSTFIQPVNLAGTYNGITPPVAPGLCAVLILGGTIRGSRRVWMRGLPDGYIARDETSGKDKPPGNFVNLLTTWFSAMAGVGYGLRYLFSPSEGGAYVYLPVTQVDGTAGNGTSIVTVVGASPFFANDTAIFGKASKKDLPAFNGRFTVLAESGQTITVAYATPGNALVKSPGARARKGAYHNVDVFNPASCRFGWYGTRTTKNPLTHSRGARRAARIRTSP